MYDDLICRAQILQFPGKLSTLYMNQNPTTSQIGFGLAKQAFAPEEPMQMAPPGQVSRSQIQPMDYASLLNPQNQTVIRPATPSLI